MDDGEIDLSTPGAGGTDLIERPDFRVRLRAVWAWLNPVLLAAGIVILAMLLAVNLLSSGLF